MIILIISIILGIKRYLEWPIRFNSELDKFLGENNWKTIKSETKESIIWCDAALNGIVNILVMKYISLILTSLFGYKKRGFCMVSIFFR